MEKEVWKKASEDSVGQHNFFEAHPELYKAGERVNATIYYADSKSNLELLSKSLLAKDSSVVGDILKTEKSIQKPEPFNAKIACVTRY
jgi:peptidyl-prolyl cis-trans isomerase SurA